MSEPHFDVSLLQNKISDLILVIDKNHIVTFANDAASDFFNSNCKEIIGQKCHQISLAASFPCHKKDSLLVSLYDEAIRTEKTCSATHTVLLTNGRKRIYDISACPIKSRGGEVLQGVEVIRDITDKYNMEEELKRRVKELEEFYDIAVERELKMVQLKNDIETLRIRTDKSAP